MFETQWLLALAGGMLVGLSALMLMLFAGLALAGTRQPRPVACARPRSAP